MAPRAAQLPARSALPGHGLGTRDHVPAPLLWGSAGRRFGFPNSWRFLVPGEGLEFSCLAQDLKRPTDGHGAQGAISPGPVGLGQRGIISRCALLPAFPVRFETKKRARCRARERRQILLSGTGGEFGSRAPQISLPPWSRCQPRSSPPSLLLRQETGFLVLVKTFLIGA